MVYELNKKIGGLSFYEDENGDKWVVGADSVPKKLGSSEVTITFRLAEYDGKSYMEIPVADFTKMTLTNAISSKGGGYVSGIDASGTETLIVQYATTNVSGEYDISEYTKIIVYGSPSGGANSTGTITLGM